MSLLATTEVQGLYIVMEEDNNFDVSFSSISSSNWAHLV
jgi:hypothetical protein